MPTYNRCGSGLWTRNRNKKRGSAIVMSFFSEFRSRARYVVGPLICIFVFGYFAYNLFHGERGINAWRVLSKRVEASKKEYARTASIRKNLENKVGLLTPGSLDPDMLEERARIMLSYGYPGDIVILENRANKKP